MSTKCGFFYAKHSHSNIWKSNSNLCNKLCYLCRFCRLCSRCKTTFSVYAYAFFLSCLTVYFFTKQNSQPVCAVNVNVKWKRVEWHCNIFIWIFPINLPNYAWSKKWRHVKWHFWNEAETTLAQGLVHILCGVFFFFFFGCRKLKNMLEWQSRIRNGTR